MTKREILIDNDALERLEEFSNLFTTVLHRRAEECAMKRTKENPVTVSVNDAYEVISNIINVLGPILA